MLSTIQHRGPDGCGIYRDDQAGLASARLSIVDLAGGVQPVGNEDGSCWIVYNGEIFNDTELRDNLKKRGHVFQTRCDTEVVLHLYEEYGPGCVSLLNGQFAFAIWDAAAQRLFLARDRLGVRPLFYTSTGTQFLFASEIKAILAHPDLHAEIDPLALRETFTYWSPLSPHTIFRGIVALPPAHTIIVEAGQMQEPHRYWTLDFLPEPNRRPAAEYIDALEDLLIDATRIRLRADVPVGAYLSGGLDSALITALMRRCTGERLDTFSISFANPAYDEREYQRMMAQMVAAEHHEIECQDAGIGQVFPEVIWHTETPILRTAPAPMYLLAGLVQSNQRKVVLTGEGADEVFAGYDIFKEMKVRRFWARDPASDKRPLLFSTLYPELRGARGSGAFWNAFFQKDLLQTHTPYYSHHIRWNNTTRTWRFLDSTRHDFETLVGPTLPENFSTWDALGQAQYLEMTTFLSPYLLSSQADRMMMAHGVEGRYPFLDTRIVEFACRLPPEIKLPVLAEKWILRQVGKKYLPEAIYRRRKRPYRAPIQRSFFPSMPPEYVRDMLSDAALADCGLFNPQAVAQLYRKAAASAPLAEVEEMALAGILSTQLIHSFFVRGNHPPARQIFAENCTIIDRSTASNTCAGEGERHGG